MEPTPCTRRTLAAGDFARIEQCNCGAIHVTIGAVTLRLTPGALGPLAETLGDAVNALALEHARTTLTSAELLS